MESIIQEHLEHDRKDGLHVNSVIFVCIKSYDPIEENGVLQFLDILQNCHFNHRPLESLEHFIVVHVYI